MRISDVAQRRPEEAFGRPRARQTASMSGMRLPIETEGQPETSSRHAQADATVPVRRLPALVHGEGVADAPRSGAASARGRRSLETVQMRTM
ncbi:hypothetical protein Trydic_g14206 [Trypoxylus dichotomus]